LLYYIYGLNNPSGVGIVVRDAPHCKGIPKKRDFYAFGAREQLPEHKRKFRRKFQRKFGREDSFSSSAEGVWKKKDLSPVTQRGGGRGRGWCVAVSACYA
jgi:hypothetical protein